MPMFNSKRNRLSLMIVPQPIATLPFDLRRTGSYPRDPRIDGALMRGPETVNSAEAAWLPQRFFLANRWKIGQTSSAAMSPLEAVRQSGSIMRETRAVGVPAGTVQTIHDKANELTRGVQHQMRPIPAAQTRAAMGPMIDNMSQSMPQVSARVDPRSLQQSIYAQQDAQAQFAQGRAARKGAAITSALQTALWGIARSK